MSVHIRVHGYPREKALPTCKKASMARIPRIMVDIDWLESHTENDTPLRIEEFETIEGGNGDVEDEDDLYGDQWAGEGADPWDQPE